MPFSYQGASRTAGFEFGLYHFFSKEESYVLYVTNEKMKFIKLELDVEVENQDVAQRNFTVLGGHHFPSFFQGFAFIAVGEDIIELNMDAEPPTAERLRIGHKIVNITVTGEAEPMLNVSIEKEDKTFLISYCKHETEWQQVDEKFVKNQIPHIVNRRSGIVSGTFVTVSPTKHYFCHLGYMQLVVKCDIIEDCIKSGDCGNTIELPSMLLPGDVYLHSDENHLIVKRCVPLEGHQDQILDEPLH